MTEVRFIAMVPSRFEKLVFMVGMYTVISFGFNLVRKGIADIKEA